MATHHRSRPFGTIALWLSLCSTLFGMKAFYLAIEEEDMDDDKVPPEVIAEPGVRPTPVPEYKDEIACRFNKIEAELARLTKILNKRKKHK